MSTVSGKIAEWLPLNLAVRGLTTRFYVVKTCVMKFGYIARCRVTALTLQTTPAVERVLQKYYPISWSQLKVFRSFLVECILLQSHFVLAALRAHAIKLLGKGV
jgi:hypothetical protein